MSKKETLDAIEDSINLMLTNNAKMLTELSLIREEIASLKNQIVNINYTNRHQ